MICHSLNPSLGLITYRTCSDSFSVSNNLIQLIVLEESVGDRQKSSFRPLAVKVDKTVGEDSGVHPAVASEVGSVGGDADHYV